jgi:hypothetical protein
MPGWPLILETMMRNHDPLLRAEYFPSDTIKEFTVARPQKSDLPRPRPVDQLERWACGPSQSIRMRRSLSRNKWICVPCHPVAYDAPSVQDL